MGAVPVILVGHGGYADGVRDAAEMILGEQQRMATVSLAPDDMPERVTARVREAVAAIPGGSGAGALVLADLFGGSPANAAAVAAADDPGLEVVAGLSLPMLLEVLTSTEETAAALAALAMESGRAGVRDVMARLRGRDGPRR